MKVALLGAPGSGKSNFAKRLATHMGKGDEFKRPSIIDHYVEDLERKTGYAYGSSATYLQNFQIVFHRWTLEQQAQEKGYDVISCGTIYETLIYSVLQSNLLEETQGRDTILMLQDRTAMNFFGMLETMMYEYEAVFYLPYDGKTILEKGASPDIVVDQKIPEVLEGYSKEFIRLDESERANVKHATELIRAIRSAQQHALEATEDEQQGVLGSGRPDSEESSERGPVPDVRDEEGGAGSGDL